MFVTKVKLAVPRVGFAFRPVTATFRDFSRQLELSQDAAGAGDSQKMATLLQ
jgi:hypothetical protein